MARPSYRTSTQPATLAFVRHTPQGVRIFTSAAEAEWHTEHTEERRQQAEQEGSFAALVCNPNWRMARER